MKKEIWIALIAVIIKIVIDLIIIITTILSYNDININECLELRVPLLSKRENIELQSKDFFSNEKLIKIYLSDTQMNKMLTNVEKNRDWIYGNIDERLHEKMKNKTRENIYNKIPYIENKYWIFTNRSHAVDDKHSIDNLLDDMYYAISFGILDIDNKILYYYEYDK